MQKGSDSGGRRVGVDVGGTFTDVVTVRDGRVRVHKVPSTPEAPQDAVLQGLDDTASGAADHASIDFLAHGTTVATNAVLEGNWADAALVTTDGFRDVLEIGRQARPDIYDLFAEKPDPVVPRDRRFEVRERLDERGEVLEPLEADDVARVAERITNSDAETVAVSLLFAYEDPAHERAVAEGLRDAGLAVPVSLSSEVLPELREYERTLATAVNAALVPVMADYLDGLAAGLDDRDVPVAMQLMQSNGGLASAETARERPVTTLLSGPAAGVAGATHVAGLAGATDLVTMDMGGTSCDVSLVTAGEPVVTTDVTVGEYPLSVPMVDVHTVGAGGGSIAWLDAGGALRVGPRSAGADPGPVCYGRGGTEPTLTDAHAVLGRIDPGRIGGEDFAGAAERAADAIRDGLADPLDRSLEAAARGILEVADATMERALRVVSVERGHDPRDFGLVAFGGAGPLHACRLAESLSIPRVFLPRAAGVLSALGLLITDAVAEESVSRVRAWDDVEAGWLAETAHGLATTGRERLVEAGYPPSEQAVECRLEMRYRGQGHEVTVPADELAATDGGTEPAVGRDAIDAIAERFHEVHETRYGHADPASPVELVTVRARVRGLVEPPDLHPASEAGTLEDSLDETRSVDFGDGATETTVYERESIPTGATFDGPAVVEGAGSTAAIPPDWHVAVDEYGTLEVTPDA